MAQYILDNLKTLTKDYGAEFAMNFTTAVENGKYHLKRRNPISEIANNTTYSNLASITGMIERNELVSTWNYVYGIAGQRIWKINPQTFALTNPHTTSDTAIVFPSLWVDDDNDLYWTSAKYLGKFSTKAVNAVTFTGAGLNDATSGGTSTTEQVLTYVVEIDGTGTPDTFKWSDDGGSTWDATTVAITGSAQTLNNGVTITFAATTGHTSGNKWTFTTGVWDDDFKDFTTDLNSTYNSSSIKRPFISYEDACFIGNKDYLAYIDKNGDNFDSNYKQLPQKYEVTCGATNSGLILVGANKYGKGMLLLWDTVSAGWNNKIYLDNGVFAIKPYKSGWIFYAGAALYYTNGYTIEKLDYLPNASDVVSTSLWDNPFLEIIGDNIYTQYGWDTLTKSKRGIVSYNIQHGTFDLISLRNDYYAGVPYSMYYSGSRGVVYIAYTANSGYYIGIFALGSVAHTGTAYYISRKLSFPKKVKINSVKLKISHDQKFYYNYPTKSLSITVAGIADNKLLWNYGQPNATLSSKYNQIQIDYTATQYAYNQVEVGDMVLVLEKTNAAESAFITDIDSSTPAATIITLDTSLTGDTASGTNFNIIPARKFDTKTITDAGEVTFYNNANLQLTDEFYLLIKVVSTYFPLTIDYAVIEYE